MAGLRLLRSVLGVLGVVAVLAGCGSSDPGGRVREDTANKARQLVSAAEVARQPPAEPYRALLEWWRLMQYRDPVGALDHLTAAGRRQVGPTFDTLVYRDFGPWLQRVKPKLLRTEANGNQATLFLQLTVKDVLSSAVVRDTHEFVAIEMAREGGQWRLADLTFFQQNAARLSNARTAAEQRAAASPTP